MKKIKYLLMGIMVVFLTGCVKFNVNMDIKKDKSMDFNIIYALDKTVFGEDSKINKDDFKEAEKEGFTITEYKEGNLEGFTLSRKIKNIDDVSSEQDAEYDLSGLMGQGKENKYIFKVEKSLFKDTYTANFKFDANSSGLNDLEDMNQNDETLPDENDFTITSDDNEIDLTSEGNDLFNQEDLTKMMSALDLSFNVTVPYGVGDNNATKVDGKKLTWSLSSTKASSIQFEFNIYNLPLIIGIAGGIVLLVIIIIFVIFKGRKNKKEVVVNNNETVITNDNTNSNIVPQTPVMKENPVSLNENN